MIKQNISDFVNSPQDLSKQKNKLTDNQGYYYEAELRDFISRAWNDDSGLIFVDVSILFLYIGTRVALIFLFKIGSHGIDRTKKR